MARWVSVRDAAAELGVAEWTVRRWVHAGRVPGKRIGPRLLRVDMDRVEVPAASAAPTFEEWLAEVVGRQPQ
jgi:excisionase family DNA binding protein